MGKISNDTNWVPETLLQAGDLFPFLRPGAGVGQKNRKIDLLKRLAFNNVSAHMKMLDTDPAFPFWGHPIYRQSNRMEPGGTTFVNTPATFTVGTIGSLTVVYDTTYGLYTRMRSTTAAQACVYSNNFGVWNMTWGFFLYSVLVFPDASYNQTGAATGTRIFSGIANVAPTTLFASDDPAGHRCGFSRIHTDSGLQNTNWWFTTKDNVTEVRTDTGLVFNPVKKYDSWIFVPKAGGHVYAMVRNLTDSTSSALLDITTGLPTATMNYWTSGHGSVNAVTRDTYCILKYSDMMRGITL